MKQLKIESQASSLELVNQLPSIWYMDVSEAAHSHYKKMMDHLIDQKKIKSPVAEKKKANK